MVLAPPVTLPDAPEFMIWPWFPLTNPPAVRIGADRDVAEREAGVDRAVVLVASGESARIVAARDVAEREAARIEPLFDSDKTADGVVLERTGVGDVAGRERGDDRAHVVADESADIESAAAHVAGRERSR